jgi:tetratricopeptide (TPR) repeat protein
MPSEEVRRLFAAALERQGNGDAQAAIDLYVRIIELQPELADSYNNIAILLKGMRRLPAAVGCLKRAVQLAPNSGSLWSNLGNMLWMSLDFEPAMAAFRRALALEPKRPGRYSTRLGLQAKVLMPPDLARGALAGTATRNRFGVSAARCCTRAFILAFSA